MYLFIHKMYGVIDWNSHNLYVLYCGTKYRSISNYYVVTKCIIFVLIKN